jgi:hypothetical protein
MAEVAEPTEATVTETESEIPLSESLNVLFGNGEGVEGVAEGEGGATVLENNDDNCVVCFEPTTEKSTQLFLYNCRCVYFVHDACFRRWRVQTGTDRVCLICREGLESFEDEEGEREEVDERRALLRPRIIAPRLAEIPIRAAYRQVAQPAPYWWALDTEQKMLFVAAACFLLVLLFHLRHSRVIVYAEGGNDLKTLLLSSS